MSVVKREYIACQYIIDPPPPIPIPTPPDYVVPDLVTKPYALPDWFVKSPPQYKKIVRVLGATGFIIEPVTGEDFEIATGVRLMGNLTKDFPLNGFIMMMNNYDCVKEFDITYSNIRDLTFWCRNGLQKPYPISMMYMDLVVELELLLTTGEE
jgi:hypothetical protein